MSRFMYQENRHDKNRRQQFITILLFAVIIAVFLFGIVKLSGGNKNRQRETLDRAISRTITNCYAVEGVYPESMEYMKKAYGLSYNEDLFFVDYRVPGGNIRPTYVIIEKGGGK